MRYAWTAHVLGAYLTDSFNAKLAGHLSPERRHKDARLRTLMRAAQTGDKIAYAQLLNDLIPLLRAIVRSKWGGAGDREDIVQEVLLSVHSVRHTYDPARPFLPWLYTIVSRRIADMARSNARKSAHELAVDVLPHTASETFGHPSANSDDAKSDDAAELKHLMNRLPQDQRRAVELMKLQGLTLEEASSLTGKSVASLKVSVHRAIKAMQRGLQE